jgi:hypothetical protein
VTDRDTAGLSPHVAELIEKVEARVAAAPTVQEIRELAEKVIADSRANALTITEIRELTNLAVCRAQQVQECAFRLAEMVQGVADA